MCPTNKAEKGGLLNQVSFNCKFNKGAGWTFMNVSSGYRVLRAKTLQSLNVYNTIVLAQDLAYG